MKDKFYNTIEIGSVVVMDGQCHVGIINGETNENGLVWVNWLYGDPIGIYLAYTRELVKIDIKRCRCGE